MDYISTRKLQLNKGITRRLQFVIAPSFKCNYQCKYCFEGTSITHQSLVMTPETQADTIEFILNTINRHPEIEYVAIQWYGGEPLLNKDIILKISKELRAKSPKPVRIYITSNGRYLTHDVTDALLDLGINGIEIAIEGLADEYTRIKQCNTSDFKILIDNLVYASEHRLPMTIIIKSGYKTQTFNKQKQLIDYLINEKNIRTNYSLSHIICYNKNEQAEYLTYAEQEELRLELAKYINNKGIHANYISLSGEGCFACVGEDRNHYIITPNGNLYRCEHKIGLAEYCIGNIRTYSYETNNPIEDILFNGDLPSKCLNCDVVQYCNGHCPIDMRQNPDVFDCKAFKENLKKSIELQSQ